MEKNQIRDNHPGSATLISSLICNVYFRKDVQLNPVPVLRIRINMFLCLPDPDPLVRSTYVNVTSKSNKHKKCKKKTFFAWIRGYGSGTIPKCHGSANMVEMTNMQKNRDYHTYFESWSNHRPLPDRHQAQIRGQPQQCGQAAALPAAGAAVDGVAGDVLLAAAAATVAVALAALVVVAVRRSAAAVAAEVDHRPRAAGGRAAAAAADHRPRAAEGRAAAPHQAAHHRPRAAEGRAAAAHQAAHHRPRAAGGRAAAAALFAVLEHAHGS